MTTVTQGSVALRDGRTLEYDTIGDPSAPAVMWLHGAGDSRQGRPPRADVDGAFIVLPNRPGYGGSSRHAGRTLADFADDAVELADHLGIERFSPVGWSAGLSHALAIAAKHGDRVPSVGGYGGAISLELEGWEDGVAPGMVMLLNASKDDPHVLTGLFSSLPTLMRSDPEAAIDLYCATDAALQTIASDPDVREQIRKDIVEGNAQGTEPFAEDLAVIYGKWDFPLDDITMPVRLWFGSEDQFAPAVWGHLLSGLLPNVTVDVIEGAGHSQVYERSVWKKLIHSVTRP